MKYLLYIVFFLPITLQAQTFYQGADLSYINELEDCGVIYKENELPKDPYKIFADHNCTLVRLRLWHTPSWYDHLNEGKRYSHLADVKKSIKRAKMAKMQVLLDFHLSDNWADPSKQVIPAAWREIVDDTAVLKDSLYQYIYQTLHELNQAELLPEMIQIGNETNRGILLSQAVNDAGWTLDWNRNSALFNSGIQAVRDFETANNVAISIVLHVAGPSEVDWFIENFIANEVTDFDIIGLSYYEQWHGKNSIAEVGTIIAELKEKYNKDLMVVETGYPWTTAGNDTANNVLNQSHPEYAPLNPSHQKQWLVDLSNSIQENGGIGLIYWEPAWVNSPCSTQWGKGAHYENASFFDFENNLIADGGIGWMQGETVSTKEALNQISTTLNANHHILKLGLGSTTVQDSLKINLHSMEGKLVMEQIMVQNQLAYELALPDLVKGIYVLSLTVNNKVIFKDKLAIFQQ